MSGVAMDFQTSQFLGSSNPNNAFFFPERAMLYVEGEDDHDFWSELLRGIWSNGDYTKHVVIQTPKLAGKDKDGKREVIRLMREHSRICTDSCENRISPALAIVDRDFDQSESELSDLFYYDFTCLETMLAAAGALDRVIGRSIDNRKKQLRARLESSVISAAALLGELRKLIRAARFTKTPTVRRFDIGCFSNYEDLEINRNALLVQVRDQNGLLESDPDTWAAIESKFKSIPKPKGVRHDLNRCNGHDLIKVLVIALNHGGWAPPERDDFGEVSLAELLRSSFHNAHMESTLLYADLISWQEQNEMNIFSNA